VKLSQHRHLETLSHETTRSSVVTTFDFSDEELICVVWLKGEEVKLVDDKKNLGKYKKMAKRELLRRGFKFAKLTDSCQERAATNSRRQLDRQTASPMTLC
jgi:hypothetical protein